MDMHVGGQNLVLTDTIPAMDQPGPSFDLKRQKIHGAPVFNSL